MRIILATFVFFAIALTIGLTSVIAATFVEDTAGEFDAGTHSDTDYDETNNWLELDATGLTNGSGNFTSKVLDAGNNSSWNELSWVPQRPTYKELPNSSATETAYTAGNFDMSNIVGLWHLNESSYNGTADEVVDSSGNGNHGVRSGGANTTSTVRILGDSSGSFDKVGSIDYVDLGSNMLSGSTSLTVSFWGKTNTTDAEQRIFSHNTDVYISVRFNNAGVANQLGFFVYDGTDATPKTTDSYTLTEWNHITVTATENDRYDLYVNGYLVTSDTSFGSFSTANPASSTKLGAGRYGTNSSINFDGQIDEVAVWSRVLSATEVLDLYKRGALKMQFQARSCDDDACSGEGWEGPDGTSDTYFDEVTTTTLGLPSYSLGNIGDNRYFQYKAFFETTSSTLSPELVSVTADYTALTTTPTAASALATSTLTATSTTITWTDNSSGNGQEDNFLVRYSTTGASDFNTTASTTAQDSTSFKVENLATSTGYWFVTVATNSAGSSTSTALYVNTLADTPGTPTTASATTSTIALTLDTGSNPATTTYSICTTSDGTTCDSTGYVNSSNAISSTETFQASSTWNTPTITGLTPNTSYQFLIKAKNGLGQVTALSSASTAHHLLANPPATLSASTIESEIIYLTIGTNSNSSSTQYAVCQTENGSSCITNGYVGSNGLIDESSEDWIDQSSWTVKGLLSSTSYKFLAKARNLDKIQTTFTGSGTITTTVAPTTHHVGGSSGRVASPPPENIKETTEITEVVVEEESSEEIIEEGVVEEVLVEEPTEIISKDESAEKVKPSQPNTSLPSSSKPSSNSGGNTNSNTPPITTTPTEAESTPTVIKEDKETKRSKKIGDPEPVKKAISESISYLVESVSTFINESSGVLVETIMEKFLWFFDRLFK